MKTRPWNGLLVLVALVLPAQMAMARDVRACDFDGDAMCDFATWRPSSGNWRWRRSANRQVQPVTQWGNPEDIPVPGDYDGDGRTDFATWRPSLSRFAVKKSSTGWTTSVVQIWGDSESVPVPGDYDGDGKTDFATWQPSSATFSVKLSSNGATQEVIWSGENVNSYIPVPADYDGDGKTDYATWYPARGIWRVRKSSNSQYITQQWGLGEDVPTPADYNGDGKAEFATWRPSLHRFAVLLPNGSGLVYPMGHSDDIPVPGDYDGDGLVDFATWQPSSSTFQIASTYASSFPSGYNLWSSYQLGTPEDFPISSRVSQRLAQSRRSDYDGDGRSDIAVYRPFSISPPSGYLVIDSSDGTYRNHFGPGFPGTINLVGDFDGDHKADGVFWVPAGTVVGTPGDWWISLSTGSNETIHWGAGGDVPIPEDFDGDGKTDLAYYTPLQAGNSEWHILNSSTGKAAPVVGWGAYEDVPVPADYDGDRKADIATWRPSSGSFIILKSSSNSYVTVSFPNLGSTTTLVPLPADYDGDGKADPAVWQPSSGGCEIARNLDQNNTWFVVFGASGDIPVPADYDGDGMADFVAWRPSTGMWTGKTGITGASLSQQWGMSGDFPEPWWTAQR